MHSCKDGVSLTVKSSTSWKQREINGRCALISASEAARTAQIEIVNLTKREPVGVTGLAKDNGKWHITMELVEKKSVPDAQDLLGGYEVVVDEEGHVLGFERKTLRKRGYTEIKEV